MDFNDMEKIQLASIEEALDELKQSVGKGGRQADARSVPVSDQRDHQH